MLTIQNVDVLDEKQLNVTKRKSKKTQILLYDTQRRVDDFINKIKYRKNGRYGDIPHFVVSKLGVVYQIFNTEYYSSTFDNSKIDRKQIKIAVENLGWLNKNTINGLMTNWVGDPYRSEPYVRNWREKFYWDRYTDQQMSSISLLCEDICEKHNIQKAVVPSQGYIENIVNFKGVVCKSNFSNIYTDINPSFNFRILFNHDKEKNNGI